MFVFLTKLWLILRPRLRSRARLEAENLVLRRQVLILSRKSSRARLRNLDRLILVWLYRIFPTLLSAIAVVKPETVIRWHRRGFRA
jgi:putative transposase